MHKRIQQLIEKIIPTRTRVVRVETYEPPSIAQTLDADRLHSILRSAEAGDMTDLMAVYRDIVTGHSHTLSEFSKRKLAVIGEPMAINAKNDEVPADMDVAKFIERQLEDMPECFEALVHLLDSTIYPVSLVEKIYCASSRPGVRYELAELKPVPHHLLDYTTGKMRIKDTAADGMILGTTHAADPTRYIIHRGHLLSSIPDTWGGPMRAVLFWWLFSVMDRDWWGRFLERFGAPFLEGKYDQSDDDSRVRLENAFSQATRLFGIVVSRETEIKMHQANAVGSGDAFEKFHSVANKEISKIIVGQTLSAEGEDLGFGGGQGAAQAEVRNDIRQFDASRLGHTLRTQLFNPLRRINGFLGEAPTASWGGESAVDMEATGTVLTALPGAGLRVTDEGIDVLSKRFGIPLERGQNAAPLPLSALGDPPASIRPETRRKSDRARKASDEIAATAAPGLASAFRGAYAPIAKIIRDSTSAEDLETSLRAYYADYDDGKINALVSEAMTAHSANAAENFPA